MESQVHSPSFLFYPISLLLCFIYCLVLSFLIVRWQIHHEILGCTECIPLCMVGVSVIEGEATSRLPLHPVPAFFWQLSVRVGSVAERMVIMHTQTPASSPLEVGVLDIIKDIMCILPGPQAKYLPFF